MNLIAPVSLKTVASHLDLKFEGNPEAIILGINEIHKVRVGDLTFVDHPKYYDKALQSKADFILINKQVDCPEGKGLLFSEDPFSDYNKLTRHFSPRTIENQPINPSAEIGEGTSISPGVHVGEGSIIGKNCIIGPNVVIMDNCILGDRVIIHANTTVGSGAFYYKTRSEAELRYEQLYTCGRVIIGDDVEIGSNCSIDKGVSGDTIIGKGSKLDNQIHVGHGVVIGKNCLFAAQVGIAGKTIIGNEVILWGQVGVSKDLTIGDKAIVLAQSGVKDSLDGNKVYFGSPVQEARAKMKELALLKRLPEIWKKIRS